MRLENSMTTADKVLKAVKKKLVGVKKYSGTVYPYKNGRENGYSILVHDMGEYFPCVSRRVFFSENRKSDDIVVYPVEEQTWQDTLSDQAYEDRVYFRYNQVQTAANYIVRFLTSRRKKK